MTTGDDKPKKPGEAGSRRRAVRPPTIDMTAKEVVKSAPDAKGPSAGDKPKAAASPKDATPKETASKADTPKTDTPKAEAPKSEASKAGSPKPDTAKTQAAGAKSSKTSSADTASAKQASGKPAAGGKPDAASKETASKGAASGKDATPKDAKAKQSAVGADGGKGNAGKGNGGKGNGGGAGNGNSGGGKSEPPLPTARRASLIGAGLVGALIALAIYLGLYYGGVLPRDRSTMIDTLMTQAQEFGRRTSALESSAARDAKRNLPKKVAELQSQLKELGSEPKNSVVKRIKSVEAQFAELAKSLETAPVSTDLENRLAEIEKRIESLASTPAPMPETAKTQVSGETKPADGETAGTPPASGTETSGTATDGTTLTALSGRVASLDKQLQAIAKTVADLSKADGAGLAGRLKKLGTELTAVSSEVTDLSGKLAKSTKDMNAKLAGVEKSIAGSDTGEVTRATAGALALNALEKAADSGQPYASELSVLATTLGGKTDLTLQPGAAKGVADVDTLKSRFAGLSDSILTAGAPAETGLVDTLLTSAKSLVRVRPTGQVEGAGRGAIVARIEAALSAGDLLAAETDWDSLDPAAREVSKSWADDLKARIAVNKALAGLSASLTASLSKAAAPADKPADAPAKESAEEPAGKAAAETTDKPATETNN